MSEALDLSLLKGTPEQREAVSAALLKTLKTRGGAKLKNRGLPDHLIHGLFDYVSDTCLRGLSVTHLSVDSQVLRPFARGQDDSQASSRVHPQPRIQLRWTRVSLQHKRV